jgi:hypothetical protein
MRKEGFALDNSMGFTVFFVKVRERKIKFV